MTDQDETDDPLKSGGGDTTFITHRSGATRTFLPGDIIDGAYQLTSFLGQGGMGIVFACRHIALGKEYAIKILSDQQLSKQYWTRFQAEAQSLAKLNHTGIVGIHNMGIDGGQFPYYVMDLLSGEPLERRVSRDGPLPVITALEIFIQVADALSAAHLQGIIHRDIKPSNIMLLKDLQNKITGAKIVDFGIARLSKHGFAAQSQTKTGLIFGTPFYMSPEQCQGLRVDERSDIYSLGCTIFESLTGSPPFCGENTFDTFMLHQTAPRPSLTSTAPGRNFPEGLEQALAKMMAKGLAERYQTMAEVKHDLERVRAGKSIQPQGRNTTIAPGPGQAAKSNAHQFRKSNYINDNEQEVETERQTISRSKISIISGALIVLLAGVSYAVFKPSQRPRSVTLPHGVKEAALVNATFEAGQGVGHLVEFHFDDFYGDACRLAAKYAQYKKFPNTATARFKQNGIRPRFSFPTDFFIAAIRFGNGTPFLASGMVPAPADKAVCIYLFTESRDWPGILDKFGPDDLTGLELVSIEPDQVIQKISRWHRLKELSFFNSLMKAPANKLECDQSVIHNKNLEAIDKLTHLQSLGLCGPHVSGDAIIKMHLLDTLQTLKLKGVRDPETVLRVLPAKDNLKEIWLCTEATTDDQLEPLTRMKNLDTLRIRRSTLTPASIRYFKQMASLKHLYLDSDWSAAEKEQFKKDLPVCQFEAAIDYKYWQMYPGQKID